MMRRIELKDEPAQITISEPSLKQILDTHHVLKEKLQKMMEGSNSEPLDAAVISQDNLCAIGKWLYGEGKATYGHLSEYEDVRKAHAELHARAGEVLIEHQLGDADFAEVLFKTKFRRASSNNQLAFTHLFKAAKQELAML
jgi:Chemoreceptor zinc-binding domain